MKAIEDVKYRKWPVYLIFMLVSVCFNSYAQDGTHVKKLGSALGINQHKNPKHREIQLQIKDTLVKAQILAQKTNSIKTSADKTYYWYNTGDIHMNKGGYYGSLLDGNFYKFVEEGKLVEQGSYKNGVQHGPWMKWDRYGNLVYVANWTDGVKTGKEVYYYSDGAVKQEFDHGETFSSKLKSVFKKQNKKEKDKETFVENSEE